MSSIVAGDIKVLNGNILLFNNISVPNYTFLSGVTSGGNHFRNLRDAITVVRKAGGLLTPQRPLFRESFVAPFLIIF